MRKIHKDKARAFLGKNLSTQKFTTCRIYE